MTPPDLVPGDIVIVRCAGVKHAFLCVLGDIVPADIKLPICTARTDS